MEREVIFILLRDMQVTVEKLVYGGEGLGRLDGRVVLTPFVLPGEEIRAEAREERTDLVRARLLEVLKPAPGRVAPPCPYFGRCGGCHYQHAPYPYQVEAKVAILRDQLRRLGRIEAPGEIATLTSEPWNYRNRAQFHIEGTEIGYREFHSHRLCQVDACPISSPRINTLLATVREMLRDRRWPRFVHSLEVFTDERQVQINIVESRQPVARRFFDWCAERIEGYVAGPLEYDVDGTVYRVSGHSFFQVNRYLPGRLVEAALPEAGRGGEALDLYAGVGLFALPLARRFERVTAVEAGSAAVRDLIFNAERAAAGIQAEHSDVERFLERLDRTPAFVLLDPPRAGMGKHVTRRLAELKAPRLAIVSCDPATLARDLAALLAAGYRIEKMILADLFPQTYHMETVVGLVRSNLNELP